MTTIDGGDSRYPDLNRFAESVGLPADNLVAAFEIERRFHETILAEESFDRRQEMYGQVYAAVHPLYHKDVVDIRQGTNPKDRLVKQFRRELAGNSVLDVGCGAGHLLSSICEQLPHGDLVGIDVSIPEISKTHPEIRFITSNVVEFDLGRKFDVVFSDQVMEHLAPADVDTHLASVRESLELGGRFIVCMPNRLFGPADVTRIVDFSYSGRTPAQGTHLNESTHEELVQILERNGFSDFQVPLPIPKVRSVFAASRISPALLTMIERNPSALGALRSLRRSGQCLLRLEISLVCRRKN